MTILKYAAIAVIPLFIFSSCAVLDGSSSSSLPAGFSPFVDKGSLLVVNEAGMVLNAVNPAALSAKQVTYVGSAANDIEVAGDYAFVISSLDHGIFRLDLSNGGAIQAKSLKTGYGDSPNPYNLAVDGGRVYITMWNSNRLAVLDAETLALITNVSLPGTASPQGVAVYGGRIYIAGTYTADSLTVLDAATYAVITNFNPGPNPQSVWADAAGVYLACTGTYNFSTYAYEGGGLYRLDPATYALTAIETNVQVFTVKAGQGRIYALDSAWGTSVSGLRVYSTNGAFITNVLAGSDLKGLSFGGGFVYVTAGYGSAGAWRVNPADWGLTALSNFGGGDCAFYE